jgi:hypothetical protein
MPPDPTPRRGPRGGLSLENGTPLPVDPAESAAPCAVCCEPSVEERDGLPCCGSDECRKEIHHESHPEDYYPQEHDDE